MLIPEPVKKFYAYTSKNLRRDLAEALVEFDEVHMERPEDVPGLKPPSEVSTEHLRLYSELKRSAERLIAHLGKTPETKWTGGDLSLEEMRALPDEVDGAIGKLLEVQRELDLAAAAKRTLKDLEKRRAELEVKIEELEAMIRQYYEAAAAALETDPQKLRLARALIEIDRALARVLYLVEAGLSPTSSVSDRVEVVSRALDAVDTLRANLEEAADLIGDEAVALRDLLASMEEALKVAADKFSEAQSADESLAEMRLVEQMWDRIVEAGKKVPELSPILAEREPKLERLRQEMEALEARRDSLVEEGVRRLENARKVAEDIRGKVSEFRARAITIRAVEAGEAAYRISDLVKEAQPLLSELSKVKEEIDRLTKYVEKGVKKRLKAAKEKALKDLELIFAKVVYALSQIRGEAAIEKLESDFMLEGVELVLTQGWVPASKVEALKEKLSDKLAGFLGIEFEEPKKGDKPPTYVKVSRIFRPFRLLTHKMYGWPKPRELDPTPITTVLFSLMFGFMYGDLGHGLVLAALGLLLLKKARSDNMRDFGGVMLYAGIASAAFGLMYGEAFFVHIFHETILPSPSKDPLGLITLAILFGAAELAISFILQGINMLIEGDPVGALFKFRGFGTFGAYVLAVYAAYRSGADISATVADPLFKAAAAIVMTTVAYPVFESVAYGHGVAEGVIEGVITFLESTLSLLSNSLSFLRLAGFAISHATFGVLAHELAEHATSAVGRILPMVFFNVFAMGLEGMVSFIQAMRLTFYELFTKFFSASGRKFIKTSGLLE
ncbi:MAG: V-type ATPase 116kDa subunit family protein [Candidatus Korarchaeota archaeon]|nr:V-type ATPase 116kDa subunit family protein [Candidatus Korarchaeota archaeon]